MGRQQSGCYLMLTILCLSASTSVCDFQQEEPIEQALSFLQIPVPSDSEASQAPWKVRCLEHSIGGSGFHKLLQYNISIERRRSSTGPPDQNAESPPPSCSAHASKATEEDKLQHCDDLSCDLKVESGCQLAIIQALPAALYADVDELRNLQPSVAFTTQLFGTPDAERTAAECDPTVLLVTSKLQRASSAHDGAAELLMHEVPPADSCHAVRGQALSPKSFAAVLVIPIHGRYPVPSANRSDTSEAGFWQAIRRAVSSGSSRIEVMPPLLAVKCSADTTSDAEWLAVDMGGGSPSLFEFKAISTVVPAGNLAHQPFVVLCTAAAYVIAVATIVFSTSQGSLYVSGMKFWPCFK